MKQFLSNLFKKLTTRLESESNNTSILREEKRARETKKILKKREKNEIILYKDLARDFMEIMEIPFLSLSKNRKNPIIYESKDGRIIVYIDEQG